MPDFDAINMTFLPDCHSTINFTALARQTSTPFNALAQRPPEPQVSFINAAPGATDACDNMTESSEVSQTARKFVSVVVQCALRTTV